MPAEDRTMTAAQAFDVLDLTDERRKNPRHDIISILVQAKINGEPLAWEDLAAYYFVLVGAGNETTRNLLTGDVRAAERADGRESEDDQQVVGEPQSLREKPRREDFPIARSVGRVERGHGFDPVTERSASAQCRCDEDRLGKLTIC
jgi:hypothetical protein